MLIMFRAKNYRCFHDEVVLDMRASGLREHQTHFTTIDDMKVLKTLALYGANASGKTTIIKAMHQFEDFVLQNMFFEGKSEEEFVFDESLSENLSPFALTKAAPENTEMEMVFYTGGSYYQYGFEVEHSTKNIKSEWLLVNDEEIFEIINDEIHPGVKYREELKHLPRKRKDRLYLSVLDYFADGILGNFVKEIKNYFTQELFFDWIRYADIGFKQFGSLTEAQPRFVDDKEFRKRVIDCVHSIDVGIVDIKVETRTHRSPRTGEERKRYTLKTIHNTYDAEGNFTGTKPFSIHDESMGTIKFLMMIQVLLNIIEKGGTFVIDELSQSYHPMITRFIVDLFQSEENKNGAQLIFTTHDTSLLNNSQFRRDEVAFIEKNNRGESRLYTLADLKVRSDASFAKDYFNGRYGAIPIISSEGGMP